ncbi:MAG: 1,4-dihydroxy-6-naphthoate synthase [Prevotellaceae bacterium]|jgi:1,4-dihydroxy-6-naphthoate synthase|nr:1,4-dihydroxy-6-naphthoate synthase [Prevotellaceae bacterium]
MRLTLGFSPCPNDTFIFDALVNNKIKHEFSFDITIADVEELNRLALDGKLDITKMSYHAYACAASKYLVCESGSALGRGNGPLFVSRLKVYPDEVPYLKIAIPGEYTTAAFLLKYAFPTIKKPEVYLFSDIEDVVMSNEADAGVLIHEGRFTYKDKGLRLIMDLGERWELFTKQPIPLGCIAMNRDLPENVHQSFSTALRESILFANANPASSHDFVRQHAQEQTDEITGKHIALFVNDYTLALGDEGRSAVNFFLNETKRLKVVESIPEQIFSDNTPHCSSQ